MPVISHIHARQILDSRGTPTVEVDVTLDSGAMGRASVPSGASTGVHEALELRDQQKNIYCGKGVEQAIHHIQNDIAPFLLGREPFDQREIDSEMVVEDGTPTLQRFGANSILAVSLAVSKAAAIALELPYYQYINQLYRHDIDPNSTAIPQLPRPMFNILNGGAHTQWQTTDIQEFMIVPLTAPTFAEALRWGDEIYFTLKNLLRDKGYSTMVGDEGGFAPHLKHDVEAIELILEAIEKAGYIAGKNVGIALDPAASEWAENGKYHLRIQKKEYETTQLIAYWQEWIQQYPIISLEDGLAEDDWTGWHELNQQLGSHIQLVGDDLLVTNLERIDRAIEQQACNCLLMKPNQIGTLTESLQAIARAKQAGWHVVVSHRSGETEDTSIADIAVGTQAGQIKTGAPARSERLAKYNQLLRIEEMLQTGS